MEFVEFDLKIIHPQLISRVETMRRSISCRCEFLLSTFRPLHFSTFIAALFNNIAMNVSEFLLINYDWLGGVFIQLSEKVLSCYNLYRYMAVEFDILRATAEY